MNNFLTTMDGRVMDASCLPVGTWISHNLGNGTRRIGTIVEISEITGSYTVLSADAIGRQTRVIVSAGDILAVW